MSTRFTIAIEKKDKSIKGIYGHFDGYPIGAGIILKEHFQNEEKIKRLIELGNLSILAPSIDKPEGHSYKTPIDGHSVFYNRDRGEMLAIATAEDYKQFLAQNEQEYNYVFKDGQWYCNGKTLDEAIQEDRELIEKSNQQ